MNVTFLEAIQEFYRRWSEFNGCSTRAAYWYVVLYCVIASVIFAIFGRVGMWLSYAFALVNIIPNIALSIRRMHDIGKSGWWILISLVPLIGWIWYIVLAVTPTKEFDNPYRNA